MECDAFNVTGFKSLRFDLSTLEKKRLQNDTFSKVSTFVKPFLKVSVFISVLVWMIGENASKSMHFQTKTHLCGMGGPQN